MYLPSWKRGPVAIFRPCNRLPSKVPPSPKVMLFWFGRQGIWLPMLMPVKLLVSPSFLSSWKPFGNECSLLSARWPALVSSWVNAWVSLQPILPATSSRVVLFLYGGAMLPSGFGVFLHLPPQLTGSADCSSCLSVCVSEVYSVHLVLFFFVLIVFVFSFLP